MFKTSELYNQFHYQTSDILTPIRDYKNDFFHAHDDNLPKFEKWQIGKLGTIKRLQGETNENSINDINNMDDNCLDDIDDSSSEKMSEASMETTPGQLHNIIKMFYESEIEYLENLGLINSVYRARLKGRRMPKSKRNLKLKSQEELLLFGNIDTITSISVIFVNMLKDLWNSDKYWKTRTDTDDIHSSGVINEMQTIFEQHLGRCRSTYIHYTIAHSRQMALYESVSIRKHFGGWFEDCMKHARFISLRDLLRYPIIRIDSWLQVLDDIVDACDEFSDITKYSGLIDVQQKYLNFKGILTDELQEYGTNTSLDCALSPGDIIDNYHSMSESEYNFTMSEVSDVKPLSYRPSSSRYEEQSSTASIEQKGGNSFHDNLVIKEQIACDITFADHIVQFTKMHQGVARLKVLVSQMNLLTIPDNDINLLLRWKKVVDTGGRTSDTVCIDGSKLTNLDQHAQDLNKLKEKLTILRLTDMESNVLMPLVAMLQKCQAVKHQLRDLKTLEKDYILYLKEKKKRVTDIRTSVIGKHYEVLREVFNAQLPVFNKLLGESLALWLKNYNRIMIEYYRTLAGKDENVLTDHERPTSETSDNIFPAHVDLLQGYATSRTRIKHAVHNQWDYPGYPTTSRVVRRLFEL